MLDYSFAVSTILPTYNGKKTICRAIESFLNQTMKNSELILSDDCSTDGTLEIIKQYVDAYPDRIRLICMDKNSRGSGVLKQGITIAKGKYINILDQDDWMEPTMLEKLYSMTIKNGTEPDLVDCNIAIVSPDGSTSNVLMSNTNSESSLIDENRRKELLVNPGYCLTKLIKKSFLIENNIWHFDCCSYEDNYFLELCVAHAKDLIKVNEALYYKMQRDTSVTRSMNNPITYDRLESALSLEKELKQRGFFERYPDECSFRFVELYYVNSIIAFLCRFNPSELSVLKKIRNYTKQNYPNYRNNKYFKEYFKARNGNAVLKKKWLSLLCDVSPLFLVHLYNLYKWTIGIRRVFLKL